MRIGSTIATSPAPPTVVPKKPIEIIPLSQLKRKCDFELIIEVLEKRFRALNYLAKSSSTGPMASSSHNNADDELVVVVTCALVPTVQTSSKKAPTCTISTAAFNVELDPEIRNITVTRAYMSSHFGAHPVQQFCKPMQEMIDKHGYDHFHKQGKNKGKRLTGILNPN